MRQMKYALSLTLTVPDYSFGGKSSRTVVQFLDPNEQFIQSITSAALIYTAMNKERNRLLKRLP